MASIVAEYTKIVDRWYGRWQNAVGAARVSNYPPERFTADVVESWVDWSYAAALPWASLGVLDVGVKPIFPVVRFVVTAKNNMTQVVPIQMPTGGAGVQAQQLDDPGGTKNIPAAHVSVTRADGYLYVTLINLGAVPAAATADLYAGGVLATPVNVPIARVEVVWPG